MRPLATVLAAVLLWSALPSPAAAASVTRTWAVGNEPFGATVDPRDGKVYVTISNSSSSSSPEDMYVVDPASSVPSVITLPAPQVSSVLDTGLDRLFVTLANGTLAVIDLSSRSLVATVPNAGMLGSALDPTTHYVYAAMAYGGVAMTDGATGTVLHRASGTGDAYWSVALDVARQRLYATNANPSGPTLVAFDARDLTEIGRVALPEIPRLALAVDGARGLVYVSGYNTETGFPGSHLYAVDETSLAISKTLDVGLGKMAPFAVTLDPATGVLYASDIAQDGTGELVSVDTATFTVAQRTPLPWQPGQSAIHPDGHLYVPGFNAKLLAQLSVSDRAPTASVSLNTTAPKTNDVLTATAVGSDPDNDPLTFTYTWTVNGVARRTTTTAATSDSFDLSLAGNGDRGDDVAVSVIASDGTLSSPPASASVTVANTAPTVGAALDDTTPGKRDVVTATATASDADHDALGYTYTWRLRGSIVRTVATAATTDAFDLSTVKTEYGDVLAVDVVATDGSASAAASATATITIPRH